MKNKVLLDYKLIDSYLSGENKTTELNFIIDSIKKNKLEGWISSATIVKLINNSNGKENLKELLDNLILIPDEKKKFETSLSLNHNDYLDNVQIESAKRFNLDTIITDNKKKFQDSKILVFTPEEFFNEQNNSSKKIFVPFLDLKAQFKDTFNEIQESMSEVILNTAFILGKKVSDFENDFSKAHNVKYCFGVSSGTDGNHLASWSLGVQAGDEIIIPANTFIATAWGATLCGAVPVFVDCEEDSYNIDPYKIEKSITKKTKAIVAVHLYGQPADLDRIREIAKAKNIFLIEDAAQAHIAEYKGQRVGGLSDICSFSFYPGKNLGAYGEGGAVTTNNEKLANKIKMLREHGQSKKYYHETLGHNYRMEGLQGAVLGVKLKYLDKWTESRRAVAKKYNEQLKDIEEITLPKEMDYAKHVYHLFVIKTSKREELQNYLNENNISTGLHYPIPLHLQNCFQYLGYKKGDFPVTENLADNCLSLPMYAELTDEQIEFVCEQIKYFFKK